MKHCPKCNFNYADETLEFCLEDGSRLINLASKSTEIPTKTFNDSTASTEKTVNLPFSNEAEFLKLHAAGNIKSMNAAAVTDADVAAPTDSIDKTGNFQNHKIVEISAVTISLIHNWWQWLYLNNQYYSSFSSYVLSANFLMWLLLLAIGTAIGLYGLKHNQNKTLPIIGLVILSINLLLFLVPKH
jgi:hypothetical protein